MNKFQVLFAMLFVALTFSLTSCSDDATSAPASPFTKSATQPDSYMPLNQANTWTYTSKLPQVWIDNKQYYDYTKDITCSAFNDQKSYKVFSSQDGYQYGIYEQSNQIWELKSAVGTIEISPFDRSRYSSANNGITSMQETYNQAPYNETTMSNSFDITSTKKLTKYELCSFNSLSVYDEKITINGHTFDCVVVSTLENSADDAYELTYFAKGYGLVKWANINNNIAFEEVTLKSCSLK